MEIRSISKTDLKSVFLLLSTCLSFDDLTEDLVKFRIFEDPDYDPDLTLGIVVDGRIVSIVCATVPTKFPKPAEISSAIAWIKVFGTSREYKNRGFESKLFDRILEVLRHRAVEEARFSDRGNWHFWPGLDLRYEDGLDFLIERGFSKDGEYVDFVYDLSKFWYPRRVRRARESLTRAGITFKTGWQIATTDLLSWVERKFSPFWSNEVEFALKRDSPSVFVASNETGELLGFATINGLAPGRFGPAGVSDSQRGKGIGTVLLYDAFQALKDQGFPKAVVHWTDHLFFYTQVPGLCGVRDYWVMRRKL